MTSERNAEVQRLRALVDAKKRSVEAAEKRYDVHSAVAELHELAAPLHSAERFSSAWKVSARRPHHFAVATSNMTHCFAAPIATEPVPGAFLPRCHSVRAGLRGRPP